MSIFFISKFNSFEIYFAKSSKFNQNYGDKRFLYEFNNASMRYIQRQIAYFFYCFI